jgi:hypothetical protein
MRTLIALTSLLFVANAYADKNPPPFLDESYYPPPLTQQELNAIKAQANAVLASPEYKGLLGSLSNQADSNSVIAKQNYILGGPNIVPVSPNDNEHTQFLMNLANQAIRQQQYDYDMRQLQIQQTNKRNMDAFMGR